MCEIAAVDPDRTSPEQAHQLAGNLYHEQGDGLGMVIVKRNEEEDKFEYETFSQVNPHWQTWWAFMRRNWNDAWRVFIHGRKLSTGEVNRDSTHPIDVDCPKCETDHLIHNGTIRNHEKIRKGLERNGHEFTTEVDTEVIAHKVGELPETIDDAGRKTHDVQGSVNYMLFAEDKILIHTERKYYVTDDLIITCRNRKSSGAFGEDEEFDYDQKKVRWAMARPDGTININEKKKWSSSTHNKYSTSGNSKSSRGSSSVSSKARTKWRQTKEAAAEQEVEETTESSADDQILEVYDDLLPTFDDTEAYEVAPGVIKVVDVHAGEEYIRRRDEPELYYYYATHRAYPGDETLKVADLFDADGNLRDAEEVNETVEKAKEERMVENISSATMEDVAERILVDEQAEDGDRRQGTGNQ